MVLGGTIYSAMDGLGGPILGGTTYSMTGPLPLYRTASDMKLGEGLGTRLILARFDNRTAYE